jgi:hypothetical protein
MVHIYPTGEVTVTESNPLYIDSACDGDITIYASMTDWATGDSTIPYKMQTCQLYKNITDVTIEGNGTYWYSVEFGTTPTTTFPDSYNHGNILIQYTVYETSDDDSNFDVTWDCFPTITFPTGFTNTAPASTIIESDNSDVNMSNVTSGTTAIQRFYMAAYTKPAPSIDGNFPSGILNFTIKNNLPATVTLSNIITKPAILYYADASGSSNTNAAFSFDSQNYIIGTISGYASITAVTANYIDAYKSNYPEEHWLTTLSQTTLYVTDDPTVYKSAIRYSDEVVEYYNDHSTDASYNIQVTGLKCGGTSDVETGGWKFSFGTSATNVLYIELKSTGSLTVTQLLDVIDGINCFGITKYFDDNGQTSITYAEIPAVYRSKPDFYSNPGNYCSPIYVNGSSKGLCETTESDQKFVYLKINDYDEWITVYDSSPVKFSDNFEFPTEGLVASSDIFYYGKKKANTIIAKGSGEYDLTLKVSYNKIKGVYVDYDDEVDAKYGATTDV